MRIICFFIGHNVKPHPRVPSGHPCCVRCGKVEFPAGTSTYDRLVHEMDIVPPPLYCTYEECRMAVRPGFIWEHYETECKRTQPQLRRLCGCTEAVITPSDFTQDTPMMTISQKMCAKHFNEQWGGIRGSIGNG